MLGLYIFAHKCICLLTQINCMTFQIKFLAISSKFTHRFRYCRHCRCIVTAVCLHLCGRHDINSCRAA